MLDGGVFETFFGFVFPYMVAAGKVFAKSSTGGKTSHFFLFFFKLAKVRECVMNCNKRNKKDIARFTILELFENLQYFGN